MKNRNLNKLLVLVLSLALLVCAVMGVSAIADEEEGSEPVFTTKTGVVFDGEAKLAVYATATGIGENTLKVIFGDVQYDVGTDLDEVEAYAAEATETVTVDDVTYGVYYTRGINPKDFRKDLHSHAVIVDAENKIVAADIGVDTINVYTELTEMLKAEPTEAQMSMYSLLLNYAAACQALLDEDAGTEGNPWADEYYFATINGVEQTFRGNLIGTYAPLTAERIDAEGKYLTGWTNNGVAVPGWTTVKLVDVLKPGNNELNYVYAAAREGMVKYETESDRVVAALTDNGFGEYVDGTYKFGKVDKQVDKSAVKITSENAGVYASKYVYETDFMIESWDLTASWVYKFCMWNGESQYNELCNVVPTYKNETEFIMGNATCKIGEWNHVKLVIEFAEDGTAIITAYVNGYASTPGAQTGMTKEGKYAVVSAGVQMRDSNFHDCKNTTMYLDNTVVYAEGEAVSYDIVLDAAGGECASFFTVTMGEAYELPTPVNGDVPFVGWFDANDNKIAQTGTWYHYGSAPTYTAKWADTVKVTLNANGGALETTEQTVYSGSAYELPTPTLEGVLFGGWFDAEGNYVAPNGTWPVESALTVALNAVWYVPVDGTANDFETDGKYINASVSNDQVANDGKVTVKPAGWDTNTWFSVGGVSKVYGGNADGTKYVFETEFTYNGGVAPITDSAGAGFVGFTATVTNSNEHMYYYGNVFTSKTADADGDAEYVTIFGATYYKGVTYQVRYEQIVGTNLMVVYTNGEFSHVFDLIKLADNKIESNKLDPTSVCKFMYVWRTAGKGITVTLDNTYAGIEGVADEYSFTIDANGGTLPEGAIVDYTVMTGMSYELPVPVCAGLVFNGWYYGDVKVANAGKWSTDLEEGAKLVASWKYIVLQNTNDFENGAVVNGAIHGATYADGVVTSAPGAWQETYFSFGKSGQFNGPFSAGTKYVVEMDFTYNGGGDADNLAFVGIVTSKDASIKRDNGHMYSYSTMPADENGVTLFGQKLLTGVTYKVRYEFTVGTKVVEVYTNGVYVGSITATVGKDDGNANTMVESFAFYWRGKGKPTFTFDNVYTAIITDPITTNVTLDPNCGTLAEDAATKFDVTTGAEYTLPTPNGGVFVFAGWYYGDILVPTEGNWTLTVEAADLVAKWIDTSTTKFPDAIITANKTFERAIDKDPLVEGNKVIFTTQYTYLGLSSFNVSEDGVVTAQGNEKTNYGFARFYDGTNGAFGGNGLVKPSGNFVNADGTVVVDADGKLLPEYAELTAEEIFYEKLTWDGMVFELGKTYTVVYTFVINGDGTITAAPTATAADGTVKNGSAVKWNSGVYNITKFVFEYRSAKNAGVTSFTLKNAFENTSFEVIKNLAGSFTTTDAADKEGNRVDPLIKKPNYNKETVDAAGTMFIVDTTYKFDGIGGVFTIDENGVVSSYLTTNAVVAYIGFYNNGAIGQRVKYTQAKLASTAKIVNAEGVVVVDENNKLLPEFAELTADQLYWSQITWGGITFDMGVEYELYLAYTAAAATVEKVTEGEGENAVEVDKTVYHAGSVVFTATTPDGTVLLGKFADGPAGDCEFVYNVEGFSFYFRGDALVLGYATDADGNKLVDEEGKNYPVATYTCNHSFTNTTVVTVTPDAE